eukprot:SAG11_NODE_10765_length_807_cov_0.843220_1_plen_108_part_00
MDGPFNFGDGDEVERASLGGRQSAGAALVAGEVEWKLGLHSALQQNRVSLLCVDFDRTLVQVRHTTTGTCASTFSGTFSGTRFAGTGGRTDPVPCRSSLLMVETSPR